MHKKIVPLFMMCVAALVAVSCSSTSNSFVGEAQSSIENQNFDAALSAADSLVKQNADNPLGYYYRGVAYAQKGQAASSPQQSMQFFQQMDEAFAMADEKAMNAESVPGEIERMGAIRTSVWSSEYDRAISLATDSTTNNIPADSLNAAAMRLNNASMAQPDSAITYQTLGQVNNMRAQKSDSPSDIYAEAADAQRMYVEKVDDSKLEAQDFVILAQYYRLSDQPEQTIEILENAREDFPNNVDVVELLADAYNQVGDSEAAIAVVEELVDQSPDNAQYRLSLGTQIYQSALNVQSDYDANVDEIFSLQQELRNASGSEAEEIREQVNSLKQDNNELMQDINDLTAQATTQLNEVIDLDPENPAPYNTLGIIYQNKASVLFDQRNMTTENQQATKLDNQAKEQLRMSMENYEMAAELDPENQNYWRSLFQIYTALGMDEKASEAEQKAGM